MVRINYTPFRWVIIVSMYFCGTRSLVADSRMTAESVALNAIAFGIRDYAAQHNRIPTNWTQIQEFRDVDSLHQGTFPIKEHYSFVRQIKIPLPAQEKGDVFLMRFSPVTNNLHQESGRYIISLANGAPILNWLSETNVQKMLADAGVTELPQPEPLSQTTNPNTSPTPETHSQATNTVKKLEPSANPSPSRDAQVTIQSTSPVEPSNPAPTPDVQATSSSKSSSFAKPLLIALVAILGLAAAFILLRPKQ